MNVRPARFSDLLTVQRLAQSGAPALSMPPSAARAPSAVQVALVSHWGGVGARSRTLVLGGPHRTRGFIQAQARPGRESWDILRLSCQAPDQERWEMACASLLERICADTAERGALRAFARVDAEDGCLEFMVEHAFRAYSTELTLRGLPSSIVSVGPRPGPDVRTREPRDAWDIFSLYCAATPALVRHAESRSLKEWSLPGRLTLPLGRRLRPLREVVVGEMGNLSAWLRWRPALGTQPQVLELLAAADVSHRIPEMVRFAAEYLGLDVNSPTICRVREYDGRISATLEGSGFEPISRETLLVRHTVAWVTERQLLVAALRAQGLGLELSQYRRGVEALHQRLASSREYYDRDDRASNYG